MQSNPTGLSYTAYLDSLSVRKSAIDSGDWEGARSLFFQVYNNEIPGYWIGTPWDFNGTTSKPQNGTIACGYFLTTVMKQTGYDIDRYKMAQQASSVLIKQYCTNIKSMNSMKALQEYLEQQPDSSIFIVGLDFHTGFITKKGADYRIIHSNYIASEGVIKEQVSSSQVLTSNGFFMIGSLSANDHLLAGWMGW